MALHFDYSDCVLFDENATLNGEILTEDAQSSIVDTFIWQTLFVGMNTITPDNKEEFYQRSAFYEKVFGAHMFVTGEDGEPKPFFITREMVDLMVGLRTNASPYTKAKFRNHMYDCFVRELPRKKVDA